MLDANVRRRSGNGVDNRTHPDRTYHQQIKARWILKGPKIILRMRRRETRSISDDEIAETDISERLKEFFSGKT